MDASSSTETLLDLIQTNLKDSLSLLKQSQPYQSNPSLSILAWDQPVQILKPNLVQLSSLIAQSKDNKLPALEALNLALKRFIHKHDLVKDGHNSDAHGAMDIESCRDLFCRLDVVFATRAAGILENVNSLSFLEETLETLSVPQCSQVWTYIESRMSEVTEGLDPQKSKGLTLIRMSNDLLRRLRRPSRIHSSLAGRILSLLSKVFPLGEKSGINLNGTFHTENETRLESSMIPIPGDQEEDERKEVSFCLLKREDGEEISEPKDPFELNVENTDDPANAFAKSQEFYLKFWTLQKFFSDPSKLWEQSQDKVRVRKEEHIVDEVEEEVEEEIPEEERERMREEKEKEQEQEQEQKEVEEKGEEKEEAKDEEKETEAGKEKDLKEEQEQMDIAESKAPGGTSKSIKSDSSGASTPVASATSKKSLKEFDIPTHRKVIKAVQKEKTLIKFLYEYQTRLGWVTFKENTESILKLFEFVGKREKELAGDSSSASTSKDQDQKNQKDKNRNRDEGGKFNLAGKDLDPTREKSSSKKRKRNPGQSQSDSMDLDEFENESKIPKLSKDEDEEEREEDFFPKYLTGQRVLEYELRDPSFRRHILIQYLILFHHLLRMVPRIRKDWDSKLTNVGLRRTLTTQLNLPEGSAGLVIGNSAGSLSSKEGQNGSDDSDERLGSRDELWLRATWRNVIAVLGNVPPQAESTVTAVRLALRRETNWVEWKDSNCPSIEKPSLSSLAQQMVEKSVSALMAPVSPFPYPLGTNALSELWEGGLAPPKSTVTIESRESEEGIDEATGEPKRIQVEVRRDGLEDLEILPPIPDLRSYVRLVKQIDGRIDMRRKQIGTFKSQEELEAEEKLIKSKSATPAPATSNSTASSITSKKDGKKDEKPEDDKKELSSNSTETSKEEEGASKVEKDKVEETAKLEKEKAEEASRVESEKAQAEEAAKAKALRKQKENKDESLSNLIERKQSLSWRALRVSRSEHLNLFTEAKIDDVVALQASIEREEKIMEENLKKKAERERKKLESSKDALNVPDLNMQNSSPLETPAVALDSSSPVPPPQTSSQENRPSLSPSAPAPVPSDAAPPPEPMTSSQDVEMSDP